MQQTWKPVAGGILAIVAGSLNILVALAMLAGLTFMVMPGMTVGMAGIGLLVIPVIALAVVAIVGGISGLQRRRWGLALAGAICAIISPWALLGILSTVFIAISREEFSGSSPSDQGAP